VVTAKSISTNRSAKTPVPKLSRRKLTVGLPREKVYALLQWARENAAALKSLPRAFAPSCATKLPLRLPRALFNATRA
jgi:hypothetical protein